MYLRPKVVKFKKEKKGKIKGTVLDSIRFGSFGIKTLSSGSITAKQIESCRRVISKKIKGIGKLWIRIFPDTPITLKPNASRMGKGKGDVSHWVAKVNAGKILYEIEGVSKLEAIKICKSVSAKSHFKLVLISF